MHAWTLIAAAGLLAAAAARAQDAPPSPAQARSLAATCANCHGTDGRAVGAMKTLAGVPAATLEAQLSAYRSGAAAGTIMQQIAKGYSDAQIRAIAAYFAAQPARP